jgi:phenylalanyl-tRNA synthetase beta chain
VRNPLGEEWDTLRPSLLPGLLLALRHNLRRGARDVFLFECGRIHGLDNFGEPAETPAVAGLLVGSRWSRAWNPPTDADVDFFGAKHVVECLAHVAGIDALEAEPQRLPTFHPGRTALLRAGGRPLGVIGELHPDVARNLDLPRGVYLFELDAVALLSRSGASRRFAPPSRYPRALRDLAVVVDRAVPAAAVRAAISEGMGEWAVEVRLFDVYRGHPLPESRVSLGFAIEIGAQDRTLTDEEVDGRVEETRALLRHRFDASFRS